MIKEREKKLLAKEAIEALYSIEPDAFLLLSENSIELSFVKDKESEEEKPKENTENKEDKKSKSVGNTSFSNKCDQLMREAITFKEKIELLKSGIERTEIIEILDDATGAMDVTIHHFQDALEKIE